MKIQHILESLRELDNPCVAIMITSDKCYDNVEQIWGYKENDKLGGSDVYSASKACAEAVIHSYYSSFLKNSKVKIASARAGNVIGGGDWSDNRLIPDCIRAWEREGTVQLRSPDATRPWQHVLEPLSGYLLLGMNLCQRKVLNGESFNFGPSAQTDKTVITLLKDLSWYFENGGKPYYEVTDEIKFHENTLLKLNCDKALAYLKWHSILNYEETVQFTGSWYKNFLYHQKDMYRFTLK